jgi:hypothetical protein
MYCTTASGPCQNSHSWVEVPQNSRPYFTASQTPQLRGPGPCIYIPQEQGGPVIPTRVLGSLSVASYYSKGYGGGNVSRLYTAIMLGISKSNLYYDRQSVGQSDLVSGTHLGLATNFSSSL